MELRTLSRSQLLDRWQKFYGKTAPSGIRREVIIPFLAYRIQENAEGGLSPAAQVALKSAARQLERTRNSKAPVRKPQVKSGTRLLRRWKGETHEVEVAESAYHYREHEYRSLSEIARKITGTRWSGPAFFGLKKLRSQRGSNRD